MNRRFGLLGVVLVAGLVLPGCAEQVRAYLGTEIMQDRLDRAAWESKTTALVDAAVAKCKSDAEAKAPAKRGSAGRKKGRPSSSRKTGSQAAASGAGAAKKATVSSRKKKKA